MGFPLLSGPVSGVFKKGHDCMTPDGNHTR